MVTLILETPHIECKIQSLCWPAYAGPWSLVCPSFQHFIPGPKPHTLMFPAAPFIDGSTWRGETHGLALRTLPSRIYALGYELVHAKQAMLGQCIVKFNASSSLTRGIWQHNNVHSTWTPKLYFPFLDFHPRP